ncbi:ABC transporter substrate-binding protein [Simplicispira metamorpha]|nr:ABC transporter substrate-binding protein [Simplicispira metamorpha]
MIVLGQSLNIGPDSDGGGLRVMAAAKGYIDGVNAAGGVQGRRLDLVTLNDDGDPRKHERNVRELITQRGAVALLNCQGEASCRASAAVTAVLKVPLVGPLSGASALARSNAPWLFQVRASSTREVEALARQFKAIACFRVAIVTDAPESESVAALKSAMGGQGMTATVLAVPVGLPGDSAQKLIKALGGESFHGAVLALQLPTAEALVDLQLGAREEWPRVIASLASPHLNTLMAGFKGSLFGFTAVVPNPEAGNLRLVQEFQRNMDTYGAGHAVTFVGMEAYINTRVLVEALRRTPRLTTEAVAATLSQLNDLDLGGFSVSFARQRNQGSDWVDVGVRSRYGQLIR